MLCRFFSFEIERRFVNARFSHTKKPNVQNRRFTVKKYLFALAISLAMQMGAVAHAQTTHLNVTVPFEFTVGDTTLPAGEYDIQAKGTWGGNVLSICNRK